MTVTFICINLQLVSISRHIFWYNQLHCTSNFYRNQINTKMVWYTSNALTFFLIKCWFKQHKYTYCVPSIQYKFGMSLVCFLYYVLIYFKSKCRFLEITLYTVFIHCMFENMIQEINIYLFSQWMSSYLQAIVHENSRGLFGTWGQGVLWEPLPCWTGPVSLFTEHNQTVSKVAFLCAFQHFSLPQGYR